MKCKFNLRSFVYGLAVMGVLSFFMSPWPLWAYTRVTGDSTSGPIASTEEIEMLNGRISDVAAAILKVGKVLETKLVQLTQLTAKEFEVLRETQRDQAVSAGVSREKMQNQRDFGASAKSIFSCASGGQAAAVSSGMNAELGIASSYYQTMAKEGLVSTDAKAANNFYKDLEEISTEVRETPGEVLFPSNLTLTKDQRREAEVVIKNITAGVSDVEAPASQKGTDVGIVYEGLRIMKKQRVAGAQKTMSDTAAYYTPSIPVGKWLYSLLGEGEIIPPKMIEEDHISPAAFFYLVSKSRIGNPSWTESIHSMSPTGIARDALMMQAVQVEQNRRIVDGLNKLTALLGQQVANQATGQLDPELRRLFEQMRGRK